MTVHLETDRIALSEAIRATIHLGTVRYRQVASWTADGERGPNYVELMFEPRQGWPNWVSDRVAGVSRRKAHWRTPVIRGTEYTEWLGVLEFALLDSYWSGFTNEPVEDEKHLRRWQAWLQTKPLNTDISRNIDDMT